MIIIINVSLKTEVMMLKITGINYCTLYIVILFLFAMPTY